MRGPAVEAGRTDDYGLDRFKAAGDMRLLRILMVGFGTLAFTPAAAQMPMYPGDNVQVNPQAGGGELLLYPGGKYGRIVPRLREPGETGKPIRLHMPVKRKVAVRKTAPKTQVASAPADDFSAFPAEPAPQPKAPKRPQPKKQAPAEAAPPTADMGGSGIPFSFGGPSTLEPQQPKPKTQVAAIAPQSPAPDSGGSPFDATRATLTRYGQVKFRKDATDLVPAAMTGIRQLAGNLNLALDQGAQRVQLEAFGGAPNDKGSDARRLSLKRALTIRQLLIDAGVPAGKIDVRAMGGAADGAPDRVDVYVRAG